MDDVAAEKIHYARQGMGAPATPLAFRGIMDAA
jgi:hypothetical protein